MAELKGSFALGIMFKDFPDRVFAVRRESPLIVGVAEGECFIASDVPAILQYTRNYYLLDHDEIVTLSPDGVSFVDEHLDPIEKELQTADWDMEAAEKGGYPHFMIKEISEQPEAIRTTIMPRIKEDFRFLRSAASQRKQSRISKISQLLPAVLPCTQVWSASMLLRISQEFP